MDKLDKKEKLLLILANMYAGLNGMNTFYEIKLKSDKDSHLTEDEMCRVLIKIGMNEESAKRSVNNIMEMEV